MQEDIRLAEGLLYSALAVDGRSGDRPKLRLQKVFNATKRASVSHQTNGIDCM